MSALNLHFYKWPVEGDNWLQKDFRSYKHVAVQIIYLAIYNNLIFQQTFFFFQTWNKLISLIFVTGCYLID